MTDACIVSFASNGRENYNKAQLRLIRSLKDSGWTGSYLMRSLDGYTDEYCGVPVKIGSYPQPSSLPPCYNNAEAPYQFKPFLIQEARDIGYQRVIWCDSTVCAVKNPERLLDEHTRHWGVSTFDNLGFPLYGWISDIAQERAGITDAQLGQAGDPHPMKQIMACVIAFDFTNSVACKVFDEWLAASQDGVSFQNGYGSRRRGFVQHRHDQAVLSAILAKNGVPLLPYGKLVYEPHDTSGEYGNDFYFVNKGIV